MELPALIKDCLTGIDGKSYDPARVYGGLAVLTFLALTIYSVVVQDHDFEPQAYGIGIGTVLVAFGFGVKIKADTEPPPPFGGKT